MEATVRQCLKTGLPSSLSGRGLSLRPELPADQQFLLNLYVSVRWEELAPAPWPEETKLAFLQQQFELQTLHYSRHYADTDFGVLLLNGKPIGRWYVHRGPTELRIVDVSLLPACRNQGIATALFEQLFEEADRAGKTVSIHVEKFNPAQHLYRRLGFTEAGDSGPYWLMVRHPTPHPDPAP